MKKICMILFIGVFLALLVSPSNVVAQELSTKVKFTINAGGLLASISQGYDFRYAFENSEADWTESVPNVGSKFGFDIGASVFPIPQLEIYASYNSYDGSALGDYALTTPSWWDDTPLRGSLEGVENEFKVSAINFGLAFHPAVKGKIKPYFGAGVSSVNVKAKLLEKALIDEIINIEVYYDYYYPYYWYDFTDTIDVTSVRFREESETVWGLHAKAGVNIEVGRNVSIFAEGRYLSASAEFDRFELTFKVKMTENYYENWYGTEYEYTYTWTDETEVDIEETVKVKVGGIQGIIGIKFIF